MKGREERQQGRGEISIATRGRHVGGLASMSALRFCCHRSTAVPTEKSKNHQQQAAQYNELCNPTDTGSIAHESNMRESSSGSLMVTEVCWGAGWGVVWGANICDPTPTVAPRRKPASSSVKSLNHRNQYHMSMKKQTNNAEDVISIDRV